MNGTVYGGANVVQMAFFKFVQKHFPNVGGRHHVGRQDVNQKQ